MRANISYNSLYKVQVRAICDVGKSEWSKQMSFQTPKFPKTIPPDSLILTSQFEDDENLTKRNMT